jgi:hypothetical protein
MSDKILRFDNFNRLFLTVAILGFSLLGPIVANLLPSPAGLDPSHILSLSKFTVYLIAFLLSPIIETFFFQSFPALIATKFRASKKLLLMAVVLPFSISHFVAVAPWPSLVNGSVGGFSLGVCYIIFMQDSHCRAFFITSIVHSLHNVLVIAFLM